MTSGRGIHFTFHSVHLKRSSVQKKMQVFTQRSEVLTEEVDRILGLLQSLKNENQELKAQRSKDAASIRDARDRIAVLEQEIDSMKVPVPFPEMMFEGRKRGPK